MDKVKKIFSPGSKKDDEVLYGDEAERRRQSASKAPETPEPETLRPVEGSQKKEHSIMRQLINPGGEKYDDQRFGTTATTEAPPANKLQTHEEAPKQHTITDQILNPGGDKYDPQRFEATATTGGGDRRSSVRPEAPALVGPDTKLETDPQEKKHEHSILRQIINPGGNKYDEEGYGTTAHAAGSLGNAPSDTKDHSIARQILNPGQEKYDPVVHGSSGEPGPSAVGATTSSGLQQPTQPTAGAAASSSMAGRSADAGVSSTTGRDPIPGSQGTDFGRDAAMVGGGAAAAGAGAAAYSHEKQKQDPISSTTTTGTTTTTTTTTSHQPGPMAQHSSVTGGSPINPIGAPTTTAPQAGDSHLGRDAAIAGGAGLAGGAAYSQLNKPKDDVAGATYTERSTPLAGAAQVNPDHDRAMGTGPIDIGSASTGTQQTSAGTSAGGAHVNPIGAPEESLEGQPRLGQDAALAGGVGAAGVAAGSGVTQLNKAPDDVQQATYTERAYPVGGPHQTAAANKLDPHLPGEFPMETGEDRHGVNPRTLGSATNGTETGATSDPTQSQEQEKQTLGSRISAGVAGIASAVGLTSNKNTSGETSEPATAGSTTTGAAAPVTSSKDYASGPTAAETTSAEQPSEHHYGRDAAVVGGLGAAGAGAYAVTRDHDGDHPVDSQVGDSQTSGPIPNASAASHTDPTPTTASQTVPGQTTMTQPTTSGEKASDSHMGRDAALAGGAGAAGVGAYEASKDTGPASKTIGPHDSNIANIMDPRVKMQPEKMKESTTSGPHSSDMANKADPRVEADPAKNEKDEHHYGRDAAVAGGAGAAGAGAYAAMKDDPSKYTRQTAADDATDPATIAARRAAEKESQPSTDKHSSKHSDETGEKKRGLLDKILHPGRKSEDKEGRKSEDHSHSHGSKTATDSDGHTKLHKKALGDPSEEQGRVIEPHTGLPMNPAKYGTDGAGGTDGATQIGGYAGSGEGGVAGPDWDAIKKANTPY